MPNPLDNRVQPPRLEQNSCRGRIQKDVADQLHCIRTETMEKISKLQIQVDNLEDQIATIAKVSHSPLTEVRDKSRSMPSLGLPAEPVLLAATSDVADHEAGHEADEHPEIPPAPAIIGSLKDNSGQAQSADACKSSVASVLIDSLKENSGPFSISPSEEARARKSSVCKAADFDATHYALEPNTWDAMLLCGLPCVGKLGSALLGSAFLLAKFCQILFCIVAIESFSPGDWDLDDLSPYKLWRETDGHSSIYWSELTDQTLVSRICQNDLSLSIADGPRHMVSSIKTYQSSFFGTSMEKGVVLSCMCLIVWFIATIPEFQSICSLTVSILNLPRQSFSELDHDYGADGVQFQLTSLSYARFFCMALLMLLRMCIAVVILVSGSFYLAKTVSLASLMIRTGSLGFVLTIDEMAYTAFAPAHVFHLQRTLKPLNVPGLKCMLVSRQISLAKLGYLILLVASTVYFWWAGVRRLNDFMTDALQQLCGGNKDFMVKVQSGTRMPYITHTRGQRAITSARLAVREVVDNTMQNSSWYFRRSSWAQYYTQQIGVTTDLSLPMPLFMLTFPSCYDTKDPIRLRILSVQTGINGSTCAEFQAKCDEYGQVLLKFVCPVTCGCGNQHSGLWVNGPTFGCPREKCMQTMSSPYLATQPCVDHSPLEMWKHANWRRFVASANKSWLPDYGFNATELAYKGCQFPLRPWNLCEPTLTVGSAAPFCPVACGCREAWFKNGVGRSVCPHSCPSCTSVGQDCRATRCCGANGMRCYEKNPFWAECMPSCSPGIRIRDPPQYRTPWSCNVLTRNASASMSTR